MIRRERKDLLTTTGASFSDCERYRYTLWRTWDAGPLVNYVMLNPSTADERVNDPTIERCQRRANNLGFGGLIVTNLFALRATDPRVMLKDSSPIGPSNDEAIRESACQCEMVICAWGNDGKHLGRAGNVLKVLRDLCPWKIHALKVSGSGQPSHPLYLSYDLKPVPFAAIPVTRPAETVPPSKANTMKETTPICPTCNGEKTIVGMFPVYAEHVPESDRKPIVEIECPKCKGSGTITDEQCRQIAAGKILRTKRRTTGLGLRECAIALGLPNICDLSYAEQGDLSVEKIAEVERLLDVFIVGRDALMAHE